MQSLASNINDLKKVFASVKVRGTWGEVQLGSLLEQLLAPQQYSTNVDVKGNGERVEYAVSPPGRSGDSDSRLWLPIDAKFPLEDYQRLVAASEDGDADGVATACKQLDNRIKKSADDINKKYIDPPQTTDFAVMFLPVEGLYAEVARRPGLLEEVQRKYRVLVSGPSTLAALLNSFQMGFQTLTIQKRAGEIRKVLEAVKTEVGRFHLLLDRANKKLESASKIIRDDAGTRTRAIIRKLKDIEELPVDEAAHILGVNKTDEAAEDNADLE